MSVVNIGGREFPCEILSKRKDPLAHEATVTVRSMGRRFDVPESKVRITLVGGQS
jgi:hypothetical protein